MLKFVTCQLLPQFCHQGVDTQSSLKDRKSPKKSYGFRSSQRVPLIPRNYCAPVQLRALRTLAHGEAGSREVEFAELSNWTNHEVKWRTDLLPERDEQTRPPRAAFQTSNTPDCTNGAFQR